MPFQTDKRTTLPAIPPPTPCLLHYFLLHARPIFMPITSCHAFHLYFLFTYFPLYSTTFPS